MARETRVTCDRCRDVILTDGSTIEATAGPLLEVLPDRKWDLCRDCAAAVVDLIRAGRTELPALGGATR